MNVLHINDKIDIRGGVEVYLRDVCSELHRRGVDTRWIAVKLDGNHVVAGDASRNWSWEGAVSDFAAAATAGWADPDTVIHVHSVSCPDLIRQLLDFRPVVRHMHEPRMVCPGQGKFWARSETVCTRPFGLHCFAHAYIELCCNRHPSRLWKQYQNTLFEINEAATRYAAIIANSGYLKREALLAGYSAARLHVLPCFTDLTDEPRWCREQAPVIVFAGRFSRTKGVWYLLQAFELVAKEVPGAELWLLGGGHDDSQIRRFAKRLASGDSVRFFGWCEKLQVDAYLRDAAVVAFPSVYPESFGIVGIEAMMRGKPVVAFDVGGVRDWLCDGETGFAVQPKDVGGLASRLIQILQDHSLRIRMGTAARREAETRFRPEPHVDKLLEIYRTVLRTG